MLELGYDYSACIRDSQRVAWTLDEVMPPGTKLDFSRPFLPRTLAGCCDAISDEARLQLNQIMGNAYLNLFAFVEEYILATAVEHARAEMYGDHEAIRALLRFAEEELKHQALFERYMRAFEQDFGVRCEVLDNAAEVAGVVMSKRPIAVMILTLHIEIMTQTHYTESVRDDADLDPLFASLLKHHWLEEAQHARIDALELDKLLEAATPEVISRSLDDYLDLCTAIDGLLAAQAQMDLESLERATGETLSEDVRAAVLASQHRAYRRTFLVTGMTNRQFERTMAKISTEATARILARAETLV